MDWRVVSYFLGLIASALSVVMLIPLAAAALLGEESLLSFVLSAAISAVLGTLGCRAGGASARAPNVREGIAVTGLTWLATAVVGTLPYTLGGHLALVDAAFESVSGFTGMGGTVIAFPESLPRALLLWRSLTQWLGGLGIVVIFIALLPQMGHNAVYMYSAESSGPTEERVLPRLKDMTAVLFSMYLGFTLLAAAVYFLLGMDAFDAVNHALTTIATGGFSTYSDSVAHFDSAAIEAAMTFFIMLAGGSFALYYRVWIRGWRVLLENTEFKAYLLIFFAGCALLALSLWTAGLYSPTEALRYASFQAASISTTGFVSADFDLWPPFSKCLLLILMTVGGCAGSTAAGLKVTRAVLLVKMTYAALWQQLHPRMIASVRMNGEIMSPAVVSRVGIFFFVYLMFIALFALIAMADGTNMFDAIGMSVTTLSTVGPGFGVVGATKTYAHLSPLMKGSLCVAMLLGRLEFMTLLVMLSPRFWTRSQGW